MKENNTPAGNHKTEKKALTRVEYISLYSPHVVDALKETTLFPSVMMANALLESACSRGVAGGSIMASRYHNHFRMQADESWAGERVALSTWEMTSHEIRKFKAWFRVYNHPHESFDDRIFQIIHGEKFKLGGVLNARTPTGQVASLALSGYSSDPYYADKVNDLIRNLRLFELDEKVPVLPSKNLKR